jgi:MFS superfamily sulfate permease-like transporter
MIVAAVAKLGFIADLISKPTMIGYMNGLALTILIGQLPKLFGFKVEADGLIGEGVGFVKGLAHGEAVPAAAVVGIAGIVLILVLQRWLSKVPAVLIMVVAAIASRTVFSLAEHGVGLVGVLPPRDSRRSLSRTCTCPISGPCSPGPWGSPWCLWLTRSPPRRRSPPAPGRRSAATAR